MKSCDKHQDCIVVYDPTQWLRGCPICEEIERIGREIQELLPDTYDNCRIVDCILNNKSKSVTSLINALKAQIAEGIGS